MLLNCTAKGVRSSGSAHLSAALIRFTNRASASVARLPASFWAAFLYFASRVNRTAPAPNRIPMSLLRMTIVVVSPLSPRVLRLARFNEAFAFYHGEWPAVATSPATPANELPMDVPLWSPTACGWSR